MKTVQRTAICILAILLVAYPLNAQEEARSFEQRLTTFTNQLRMALTLATVAVHSPTLDDLHLHAQQLVNLLEGSDGRHFVRPADGVAEVVEGLSNSMDEWGRRFEASDVSPDVRTLLALSTRNVHAYLGFALTASLAAIEHQRVELAADDMLRAYAFLLAAYEKPCDTGYVPALWTILRAFGLDDLVVNEAGEG